MPTWKLTIAYDGTRYAGWQVQNHSKQLTADSQQRKKLDKQKPTIQGTLERVLKRILREPVRVVGSGRTDAGVHAEAQVAHVATRTAVAPARVVRSLNQLLPPDIAVTHMTPATGSFHARFDALRKRYRYRLFTGPVVPPFIRPYVHHVTVPLNVPLMRREAAALAGRHDFRVFARAESARGNTHRTMTSVRLRRAGAELQVELEGTGFLHTMVRSIVGTLLDIGRGRLAPGTIHRLLTTGDRRLAGTTAPACGLTLVSVQYDRDRSARQGSGIH